MRRAWWILSLILVPVPGALAQQFSRHVVVSQERFASEAGRDALRAGGNSIDAAIATAFALAVTHPSAGNLGGGGFLVAYLPETKEIVTVDFRETAPAASTPTMYLDADGKTLPRHREGRGRPACPGRSAASACAHRQWGSLPWAELVAPAWKLAREGFPVSETLARSLNAQLHPEGPRNDVPEDLGPEADFLAHFASSVKAYGKPDDTRWKAGDTIVQADLAATLERIAREGPDEFYRGKTAELIAADARDHGGLITLDDLRNYKAYRREPAHTTFRGHDVYGIGPAASGGIVTQLALNILERYDLKADGPRSARTLHRVAEASKRAFFVRATEIADPGFVPVDVRRLTSKEFADRMAESIGEKATPSAALAPFPVIGAESNHTTHLSTMDGFGGAVALTYTLEEGYGSKYVVPGAGFLLNNEMGDFNLIPGRTDANGRIGTPANAIAPGKRMLSSQSPTLVLKDGKVRLVTGSPGGRTIPSTVLWVLLNVLEFGMGPAEAIQAPRTHHPWFPDAITLEGRSWDPAVIDDLKARGHAIRQATYQGDANSIVVDPASGAIHGVPDPRRRTETAAGD
ncbi:MAG: gamma-glutamyltransferase [Isosphaeraceae bacterium]